MAPAWPQPQPIQHGCILRLVLLVLLVLQQRPTAHSSQQAHGANIQHPMLPLPVTTPARHLAPPRSCAHLRRGAVLLNRRRRARAARAVHCGSIEDPGRRLYRSANGRRDSGKLTTGREVNKKCRSLKSTVLAQRNYCEFCTCGAPGSVRLSSGKLKLKIQVRQCQTQRDVRENWRDVETRSEVSGRSISRLTATKILRTIVSFLCLDVSSDTFFHQFVS